MRKLTKRITFHSFRISRAPKPPDSALKARVCARNSSSQGTGWKKLRNLACQQLLWVMLALQIKLFPTTMAIQSAAQSREGCRLATGYERALILDLLSEFMIQNLFRTCCCCYLVTTFLLWRGLLLSPFCANCS